MKETALKLFGGVCAAAMVTAFVLVLFRMITWKLFWIAVIILAITAYWVIPWMKKK